VQASQLSAETKIPQVLLINDLQANAMGIAVLEPGDVVTLNQAKGSTPGNVAVIAAGTGLGEAAMYWDGVDHHVFASEGGHCDFAPLTEVEIDLLRYLHGRFGHVSFERVVSGPGLVNIYQFLRDSKHVAEPEWLTTEMTRGDPAAAISRSAAAATWPLCEQAVDLFVSIYAAEAGNLALKVMATGGVYLGGGIAPKMLSKLAGPLFMHAFTSKGRMQPLLESIPVKVIVNENTALLGAARTAALAAGLLKPAAGQPKPAG
jgi:glucokinase